LRNKSYYKREIALYSATLLLIVILNRSATR